jgi:hypothetical protein
VSRRSVVEGGLLEQVVAERKDKAEEERRRKEGRRGREGGSREGEVDGTACNQLGRQQGRTSKSKVWQPV